MTKTKIKVVGGEKNKKTVGELEVGDAFEYSGKNWVKADYKLDGMSYIDCFCFDSKELEGVQYDAVPRIVYTKMKVKLYE